MKNENQLSRREKEVADLLLQGKSNKQIARALNITERTVESHLTKIYEKLKVASRMEAFAKLRESAHVPGDSTIAEKSELSKNGENENPQIQERAVVTKRISLEEIVRFLVTYKIPIFIWILLTTIMILAFVLWRRTPWTYQREGEYPDEATVGQVLQRNDAYKGMVHGQFGTVPAWPPQSGYVKYNNIRTPRVDHLFLWLRYSKYSATSVPILIYLDDESTPRWTLMPVDQGSWEKFIWTDAIDLGSVERGVHTIKFYTDGQTYGVADLDKFILAESSNILVTLGPTQNSYEHIQASSRELFLWQSEKDRR